MGEKKVTIYKRLMRREMRRGSHQIRIEFLNAMCSAGFRQRLWFAWKLLRGKEVK